MARRRADDAYLLNPRQGDVAERRRWPPRQPGTTRPEGFRPPWPYPGALWRWDGSDGNDQGKNIRPVWRVLQGHRLSGAPNNPDNGRDLSGAAPPLGPGISW